MTRTTTLAGLVLSVATTSLAWAQCPPQELVPSVATSPQWFGVAVTADDGQAVVGAPWEGGRGAVYVYERLAPDDTWRQRQRISPWTSIANMRFGIVMSQSRSTLAVAAPGPTATFGGAVAVLERNPTNGQWVYRQIIEEPGTGFFGSMVHVDGDMLAVTDAWAEGDQRLGRVYIYRRDPSSGLFESYGTVDSFERRGNNRFANAAVFLSDDRVLLGDSQGSTPGLREPGAVYEFERDSVTGEWNVVDRFVSPHPSEVDAFGVTLDYDGYQLLVSEYRDDRFVHTGGVLHVYERSSNGWRHVQEILPEAPIEIGAHFGIVREFEDGQIWVRRSDDFLTAPRSVLDRWVRDSRDGRWAFVETLADPLLPGLTGYASGAAVTDDTLFVGAEWSILAGSPQGRVFAYDLDTCDVFGTRYCSPAPATSLGEEPIVTAFGSGDPSSSTLTLRATHLPPGATSLVLASMTPGFSMPAQSAAPLCLGGAVGRVTVPIVSSDAGSVSVHLDPASIPTPGGTTAIGAGDTWNFQVWFRDPVPTGTLSGFTNAIRTDWI